MPAHCAALWPSDPCDVVSGEFVVLASFVLGVLMPKESISRKWFMRNIIFELSAWLTDPARVDGRLGVQEKLLIEVTSKGFSKTYVNSLSR